MKRIIYIFIMILAIVTSLGGVSAYASYEADNSTRGAAYDTSTDSSIIEIDPEGDGNNPEAPDGEIGEDTNEGTVGIDPEPLPDGESDRTDEGRKNPFESFFEVVKEYATEIFCSLTFVGSMILAYAYKRGLIPLLTSGISTISGTVARIKESAERGEGKTDELSKILCARLTDAEVCLDGIGESLTELEGKLDSLEADKNESKLLRTVMRAQVDMLYSIFMTSSLPQYQKDEVGERICAMKEALAADEGE